MSNLQEYFGALTPARDRRLQKRVTLASLTFVHLGGTGGGIILNISETGMALAVADRLPVGEYLPCIRFQLPSSSQSIEISAQVVWLAESKKGAGIRFVHLTADARDQIANWIASEKSVSEIEHLPKPLRHDKQPLEVSSRKFRSTFSSPSGSNTDPGVSILRSAPKISAGDLPQTSSLPQGQTALEPVAPSAPHTPVIFDVSALHVAALVFSFAVIGLIIGVAATKTSVDVLASLRHGPFGKQVRLRSQSPHTQSVSGPPSNSAPIAAPTETSSSQTSRSVGLDSSAGAKTVGSSGPPEEKAKEGTRDSDPSVKVPSTDSNSSTTPEPKPSANPAERPNRNALTGRNARSAPLPASAERAHSAVAVGPIRSAPKNRALLTTKPARAATPKPSQPTANLKHAYPAVTVGPKGTVPGNPGPPTAKPATPAAPNPPPPANSEPAHPAVAAGPKGPGPGNPIPDSATAAATAAPATSPPPASAKPTDPAVAGGSLGAAPGNPGPPTAKPATPAASKPSPPAYLVTVPSQGSKPLKLVFPQKQIALSSSFAITSQLSVLVSPEPGPAVAHQPARLQAGNLVSYVEPRQPSPRDRYRPTETVKVRATIGQQGQVMDVRPVSGPIFLLSSAMSAIRQWRYQPTLLNETPVQAQQDVTIEFRLPR